MEYVRVSENGGTPIAGWFIMESHIRIWMMTGSTPIFFGNYQHMVALLQQSDKSEDLQTVHLQFWDESRCPLATQWK